LKNYYFFILVIWIGLSSCSSLKIIDKPVVMNSERDRLTLEYLETRYGLKQEKPTINPKMVVVHWTAIPTLEKTLKAFDPVQLPNWRPEIAGAGALNVAAQFVVDQDGTIYRLLPETYMARHVIGLNHCAIGIENVGGLEDKPLTKKQLKSNIKLIKYLKKKYPQIEYVIGHLEYQNFEGHELWLEKDPNYRTQKTDPGVDFLNSIRQKTSKYNWKPVPQKNQ
jgi:N-acetyl-anhydromuramyl-L-alanine amidase AmpD